MSRERLLTLAEVAEWLRVTKAALYSQRWRGDEPGSLGVQIGQGLVFRESDIERYLEQKFEKAEQWSIEPARLNVLYGPGHRHIVHDADRPMEVVDDCQCEPLEKYLSHRFKV